MHHGTLVWFILVEVAGEVEMPKGVRARKCDKQKTKKRRWPRKLARTVGRLPYDMTPVRVDDGDLLLCSASYLQSSPS
jgi:hypothetical protein